MNHAAKPTSIVLLGCGGHAKVVSDIVKREGRFSVEGFLDDRAVELGGVFEGKPIFGPVRSIASHGISRGIIAIGDSRVRERVCRLVLELVPGFEFVTAVHPTASLASTAKVEPGSVIMAGACLNPDVVIGRHSIVNTKASLDHDGRLGDFSQLAPGATAGGNVSIGDRSFVGIGAAIGHGLRIGSDAVVGMGSVVTRDLPSGMVAWGNPCRVVRARLPRDP